MWSRLVGWAVPNAVVRSAVVLGAVVLMGCGPQSSANGASDQLAAQQGMQQRIGGAWRLTSYVPESDLSPMMLLTMQADKIGVRFEEGRVRSASAGMQLDRAYRLADVQGNNFKIYIADGQGVEHESQCQFDRSGRLLFYTVTPPWRGRGVLEREGAAMGAQQPAQ
jgi:hypothetical protein